MISVLLTKPCVPLVPSSRNDFYIDSCISTLRLVSPRLSPTPVSIRYRPLSLRTDPYHERKKASSNGIFSFLCQCPVTAVLLSQVCPGNWHISVRQQKPHFSNFPWLFSVPDYCSFLFPEFPSKWWSVSSSGRLFFINRKILLVCDNSSFLFLRSPGTSLCLVTAAFFSPGPRASIGGRERPPGVFPIPGHSI